VTHAGHECDACKKERHAESTKKEGRKQDSIIRRKKERKDKRKREDSTR